MNIVVTGASRGIGKAVVQEFSKQGKNTILAIARDPFELAKLQQESPSRIIPVICDLSDEEQTLQTVLQAVKKVQHIDILINNAAQLINKPFEQTTPQEFLKIFQVNLFSIVALTQTLLPFMGGEKFGHIVNISSVGGVQGSVKLSGLSAYCATKAALINLTECLAVELKERSIHVNALALGAVQTSMLEQAFPNYKAQLTPEAIAPFIVDFALKGHYYSNGKVIPMSLSTP
jgi:3-oxoacyl-[acyl-carrier protein] reductase